MWSYNSYLWLLSFELNFYFTWDLLPISYLAPWDMDLMRSWHGKKVRKVHCWRWALSGSDLCMAIMLRARPGSHRTPVSVLLPPHTPPSRAKDTELHSECRTLTSQLPLEDWELNQVHLPASTVLALLPKYKVYYQVYTLFSLKNFI